MNTKQSSSVYKGLKLFNLEKSEFFFVLDIYAQNLTKKRRFSQLYS